jgi:hypothetical protein
MRADDAGLDRRVAIGEDVIARELEGETVLLNLETGIYFGLDQVGTRIWKLLGAGRPLRTILDTLMAEYDVEREALQGDLVRFIAQLEAKGLVVHPRDLP